MEADRASGAAGAPEAAWRVKIHAELLRHYDKRRGIKWDFASLDSAMAKAPKGGAPRGRTRRIARNSE